MPRKNWNPAAVKPSKTVNTQDDCPLFKLAAETRNQIYELVFAFELGEDGSYEIEDTSESNALSRTCQQIYSESRIMHREAYRDYPNHTFTIDLLDGQHPNAAVAAAGMSKRFFQRIKSFRVHWRADEHNKGNPLRFTSHFDKIDPQPHPWRVRVELHDEYWRGKEDGERIASNYAHSARSVMDGYCGRWPACFVAKLVHSQYGWCSAYTWGDKCQRSYGWE
jgi:hypothetical protein